MGLAFRHVRSDGSTHDRGARRRTKYYPIFGFSRAGDKVTIRDSKWLSAPSEANWEGSVPLREVC